MLTLDNVVHYLVERGFVDAKSVIDGDFLAVDATRRNKNFKIIRRNHPSYFVKQAQNTDPEAPATLHREATCYWLARARPELAALRDLMPEYGGYDPARRTLVLELAPGGETLAEYYRRVRRFPPEISAQMGALVGNYHKNLVAEIDNPVLRSVFPQRIPWVLSVHETRPEYYPVLSAGNGQLIELVRRYPEFPQALDKLRADWRATSLIHGDMKWENWIVRSASDGGSDAALKLIDWEMADLGDPAWDAGALLQAYLVFWILSMPLATETDPARLPGLAQFPLDPMQPAIRAFWQSYAAAAELDAARSRDWLLRCVSYGGARMIQSAFECLYYEPQMTAQAVWLLQASQNILTKPADALSLLLGL
ncbi:MAG: phosphotransferase [Bryobacteraceae bacterium]